MKGKSLIVLAFLLVAATLVSLLPACRPGTAVESYFALVPKMLRSGSTASLSVALFSGDSPVSGRVEATLLKDGKTVVQTNRDVNGKGTVDLVIPDIEPGDYEVRLKGNGFDARTPVRIERDFLIFLQTDKPIYKPGQTIHIRAITLDAELKPATDQVTVEVLDAKGTKIFRSEVVTDEFGMATLDLPVSIEPNLGTWKLTAATAKTNTQLDVRVEKYVLPKYEITAELSKQWYLVSEPIKGTIGAEYSFGKTVTGELEIKASKYVGQWQEYATVTKEISGETTFEIPAAGYVAGVPAAGGNGNVRLDITVRERNTGYEEKTSRLLTVAQSAVTLQVIPESSVFKPGLPFSFLVVAQTPGNDPVDTSVKVSLTYLNADYKDIKNEDKTVKTVNGQAVVDTNPPADAVALTIVASTDQSQAMQIVTASYSPSGNFIHLEQTSAGTPKAGELIRFKVHSTREAGNFYYEVIARGQVVFSDFKRGSDIVIDTTPLMAPNAKLVVYQILPNSEVAADYLPFNVEASYPQNVTAQFSRDEAKPGDKINIDIRTEGEAKVGLAAVDRSVFILAENRLNLQQVFDDLERLYMNPQAELHEVSIYPAIPTVGAREVFDEVGVAVLSNNQVPEGKEYQYKGQETMWDRIGRFFGFGGRNGMEMGGDFLVGGAKGQGAMPPMPTSTAATSDHSTGQLAEVQRVRQFFPETWIWDQQIVDGSATISVEVPDSITTWMLQAVAISKTKGLGMAEDELRAFQPFFLTVDLPYAAIRGEEFPVKVAIYNYLDSVQSVTVSIDRADWFELLDSTEKTIDIKANDIGGAEFMIRPTKLGTSGVKITARSTQAADAVIKTIIVDPEGVAREEVENVLLSNGTTKTIDTTVPAFIVDGSGRAFLTLTSSYLAQTIEGLEGLIQMPFGCGEQNMILFAPDVFITKYLTESKQAKPEVMAKAELLMITGYQRELTYRRSDGSFSAFGQSDPEGSLWLTSFVLKSFAQAKGLIFIDDAVLDRAAQWITSQQNSDGSFDPVGFVHHSEMIGGVQGKDALTAYVATALFEAGEKTAASRAVSYLQGRLDDIADPYTMALVAYALEMGGSNQRDAAYNKLMQMAKEDENGLHWGEAVATDAIVPFDQEQGKMAMPVRPGGNRSQTTGIEATAYATLALAKHGDALNSSRAAKWLVSKRNAYGGYGSTQDTVVSLQALTALASGARADVDLTVSIKAGSLDKQVRITQQNYDVLQVIDVPVNTPIEITAKGKGEVVGQVVRRYNLPAAEDPSNDVLRVNVNYDTTQVEVNDEVTVAADVTFNPPEPMDAGMVVLDISVPTGFAPVTATIDEAVQKQPERIKRYDVAGRKVIFYIQNMKPGEKVALQFKVKAMYPVKAKGVASQAYSYYNPEMRGETLGKDITVR